MDASHKARHEQSRTMSSSGENILGSSSTYDSNLSIQANKQLKTKSKSRQRMDRL